MTTHLHSILTQWYSQRDECRWVLGSVIAIEGSNYRKTGAMILVNELGQYFGLISGGCLEKSLLLEVKKVLTYNRPQRVCYDSTEHSDSPWAMSLGCGGKVTILLQPICATNQYQQLHLLHQALQSRTPVSYGISLRDEHACNQVYTHQQLQAMGTAPNSQAEEFTLDTGQTQLLVPVRPTTHIVIFGGGIDAIPLVQMASVLGWQVTLVDQRSGYAQAGNFSGAQRILRSSPDTPEVAALLTTVDAAIVMTHNIDRDAEALHALQAFDVGYVGLLGPTHRKQKVLKRAGLVNTPLALYGPMGIAIGGDLPESVALSTLAQCHQILEARARSQLHTTPQRQAV